MRGDLAPERLKEAPRGFEVAVNAQVSQDKGPHQPAPNCSLMVSPVTLTRTTTVMSLVSGFSLGKAAKARRGDQAPRTNIHDGFLLFRRKRAFGQGHSKNLVRTERSVVADPRVFDHVIAIVVRRVPELGKALFDLRRHFLERLSGFPGDGCKFGHGLQCVVPKRVDLHWLTGARRND